MKPLTAGLNSGAKGESFGTEPEDVRDEGMVTPSPNIELKMLTEEFLELAGSARMKVSDMLYAKCQASPMARVRDKKIVIGRFHVYLPKESAGLAFRAFPTRMMASSTRVSGVVSF